MVASFQPRMKEGGNVVRVEYSRANGEKYQVAYMHLSQFNVKEGDVVMAGQQLGVSGNTGNSTGPHLHFSVKKVANDGTSNMIDPSVYLADIPCVAISIRRLNIRETTFWHPISQQS